MTNIRCAFKRRHTPRFLRRWLGATFLSAHDITSDANRFLVFLTLNSRSELNCFNGLAEMRLVLGLALLGMIAISHADDTVLAERPDSVPGDQATRVDEAPTTNIGITPAPEWPNVELMEKRALGSDFIGFYSWSSNCQPLASFRRGLQSSLCLCTNPT